MSREEDLDIDGDEDYDIGYGGEEESGLFWKMTIKPNEPTEIDQPAIPGYIVHVTNACFGVKVNQKSRSVVLVNASEDGAKSDEVPICVLTQGIHENQQLDLLFNGMSNHQSLSILYLHHSTIWCVGSRPLLTT